MAGIYIHIPFCKQACHYCNFHFSTSLKQKNDFLNALLHEIQLRKDYLREKIETIYFGGGTPSILSANELDLIFEELEKHFTIDTNTEITLEANPDDLSKEKLETLKNSPVNRLSLGIQSFHDTDLQLLNRAHNSAQAINAILLAQDHGFTNITIDLIYGIQTLTHENWRFNLSKIFSMNVPHISAYCLTVEPKTALEHFIKKGEIQDIDDAVVVEQYQILTEQAADKGYEHYEISNFAQPGFQSKHNSSYWTGEKYIGFGPSAHSYNGVSRQWNVANNAKYIKALNQNKLDFEQEILSEIDKFNENIMTSLRTSKGLDLQKISETYDPSWHEQLLATSKVFLESGHLSEKEYQLTLTPKGKLLADKIISELFIADN